MIGIGLLAGVAIGFMKLSENQKNVFEGQKVVRNVSYHMTEISELVRDPVVCELNFKDKEVGKSIEIPEIKNGRGQIVVNVGEKLDRVNQLSAITIDDYNKFSNRTKVTFKFESFASGSPGKKFNRFVYLFTEVSNGKITKCLDPVELTAKTMLKQFCRDLDPLENDICEDNFSNLLTEIKRIYCGSDHPFLSYDPVTKKCLPLDAGKKCNTGYAQGYNANGSSLICYTPPTTCQAWGNWMPAPDSACPGTYVNQTRACKSAGRNIQTRRVDGTKVDVTCCSSWSAWTPGADTVCDGVFFSQERSCLAGGSGTERRLTEGTKDDSSCCSSWGSWSPSSNTACPGVQITQTRNCLSGGTGTQNRTVEGTGSGSACCTNWGPWSPDPETSCTGTTVTQTRSCQSGGRGRETRTVDGTGIGSSCCTSWSGWTPEASTACPSDSLVQTRSCTSGVTASESQTVPGTKINKICCSDWSAWSPGTETACPGTLVAQNRSCLAGWTGSETRNRDGTKVDNNWTPSAETVCANETFTQTNACGEERTISGTKECNPCTLRHPVGWSVSLEGGSSCHCVEGGGAGSSQIEDGRNKNIRSSNCSIQKIDGSIHRGNGSLTYKCSNGALDVISRTCSLNGER